MRTKQTTRGRNLAENLGEAVLTNILGAKKADAWWNTCYCGLLGWVKRWCVQSGQYGSTCGPCQNTYQYCG